MALGWNTIWHTLLCPNTWSVFPTQQEAIMFSSGLEFRVLARLTHIFGKWGEEAGTEMWDLRLWPRLQRPPHFTLWFYGNIWFSIIPAGRAPPLQHHSLPCSSCTAVYSDWCRRVRGHWVRERGLRCSCKLTTHSSRYQRNAELRAEPHSAGALAVQHTHWNVGAVVCGWFLKLS